MLINTLLRGVLRLVYGPLPVAPSESQPSGLVLVADGIGGLELCGTGLQYMAARHGLKHMVKIVRWCHGIGRWHWDLKDTQNVRKHADCVASDVSAFQSSRPGAPVFLVGKSGGCGVILHALERLPAGAVERAVLIAPAVSPNYDLTRALHAVRSEAVVFWSPLDVFLLGLGTRLFGTIDRVRTIGAGLSGFRVPDDRDARARVGYDKLTQIRWHWGMVPTGYCGGHVGADSPGFLRKYVVPLLAGTRRPETVSSVMAESSRAHARPIR